VKRNLLFLALILLLASCADTVQFEIVGKIEEVGFWHGLWHGMTLPFAWFCSLFFDSVAVYAVYNNGGWYDFGFFMGVGSLGEFATRRNK